MDRLSSGRTQPMLLLTLGLLGGLTAVFVRSQRPTRGIPLS